MDAWGRPLAFSTDDNGAEQLLDASGTQIMMEWERLHMAPAMDEMAITSADRVLEVGFGCAYSAERIQRGTKSHTIIECSEAVLQKCAVGRRVPGVIVVEGTWQQTLPALGTFDAIFMDDFGAPEMSAAEMEKCADPRYREAYAGARSHLPTPSSTSRCASTRGRARASRATWCSRCRSSATTRRWTMSRMP